MAKTEKELMEMQTLFDWALLWENAHPELWHMYHVTNEGKRNPRTGAALKRGGLKKGVPDVWLPVPCGKWGGLVIEMKVDRNRVTEAQQEWLEKQAKRGWKAYACWGFEAAAKVVAEYLGFDPRQFMKEPQKILEWLPDGSVAERKG